MSKGLFIAVINSEPEWLDFCSKSLENNGYEVITASTILQAIEKRSSRSGDKIDLVLVDVKSFEENKEGLTLLKKQDRSRVPMIVVLYATNLTPDRLRPAYRAGADDCIHKPYNEADLLLNIVQVWADHQISISENKTHDLDTAKYDLNILLVDDDKSWLESLIKYLPESRAKVAVAESFSEALDKISAETYNLVVADLRLNDQDDQNYEGMELLHVIREMDKKKNRLTPIIVASAYGTSEHIRKSFREYHIEYYFEKTYFSPAKYRASATKALVNSNISD